MLFVKNKVKIVELILSLFLVGMLPAQKTSLNKVMEFKFKDIQAIEENGIVNGYIFYYKIEKENREENRYGLCVYDSDFNRTHYLEVVKHKKSELLDAKFNGKEYCFQFLDLEKSRYECLVYDTQLEEVGKFYVPLPKEIAESMAEAAAMGYGQNFVQTYTLISLPQTGFAMFGMHPSSFKMEITAYNSTGDEIWKANSGQGDKKNYEIANLIAYDENKIIFDFYFFKNRKKPLEGMRKLIHFDTKTGEKLNETFLTGLKYPVFFTNRIKKDEGELLCGEYQEADNKSSGIALLTLSEDGSISDETYLSLRNEASKVLNDQKRLQWIQDKSILVNNLVMTKNNRVYLIGELYDKSYVYDMAIFELNGNTLQNILFAEKKKTNIMGLTASMNSTAGVGQLIKMGLMGASDFCYTSLNNDKTGLTTVYCNYEKQNKSNEVVVGSITIADKKEAVFHNYKFNSEPDQFVVLPAKANYLAIFEYFKKEKRVEMRMEKIQNP